MNEKGVDPSGKYQMQIVKDGQIHMTNMAIYAAFSVNGVAKIHTDILEHYTFADFYKLFPEKFNNKTNGVTHRRWLLYSDERLADLITSKIGDSWITNYAKIADFKAFADDKATQRAFMIEEMIDKIGWKKALILPAWKRFLQISVVISSASWATSSSIERVLMVLAPSIDSASQPTKWL